MRAEPRWPDAGVPLHRSCRGRSANPNPAHGFKSNCYVYDSGHKTVTKAANSWEVRKSEEWLGVNREAGAVRQQFEGLWRCSAPGSCDHSQVVEFCTHSDPMRAPGPKEMHPSTLRARPRRRQLENKNGEKSKASHHLVRVCSSDLEVDFDSELYRARSAESKYACTQPDQLRSTIRACCIVNCARASRSVVQSCP